MHQDYSGERDYSSARKMATRAVNTWALGQIIATLIVSPRRPAPWTLFPERGARKMPAAGTRELTPSRSSQQRPAWSRTDASRTLAKQRPGKRSYRRRSTLVVVKARPPVALSFAHQLPPVQGDERSTHAACPLAARRTVCWWIWPTRKITPTY